MCVPLIFVPWMWHFQVWGVSLPVHLPATFPLKQSTSCWSVGGVLEQIVWGIESLFPAESCSFISLHGGEVQTQVLRVLILNEMSLFALSTQENVTDLHGPLKIT